MPSESIAQQNPVTHITIPPGGVVRLPAKAQVKQCPHCSWCVADTDPLSVYPAIRLDAHIKERHTPQPTTPTPWIFDGIKVGPASTGTYTDVVETGQMVALVYGTGRGDGEFIVKAANSHEALVDAIKAVRRRLHFVGHPNEPMVEGLLSPLVGDWRKEIALIEAALALAEGR